MFTQLLSDIPWDERTKFTVAVCIVHTGNYIVLNTFYTLCGVFGWFEHLRNRPDLAPLYITHCSRPVSQKPPKSLVIECILAAAVSHFIVAPVITYYATYPFISSQGFSFNMPTPPIWTVLGQIAACILIEDFMFFCSHWTLHRPFFYKHIHKVLASTKHDFTLVEAPPVQLRCGMVQRVCPPSRNSPGQHCAFLHWSHFAECEL